MAYVKVFASKLGLPIVSDESADYNVEFILAQDWWDDGAWGPSGSK